MGSKSSWPENWSVSWPSACLSVCMPIGIMQHWPLINQCSIYYGSGATGDILRLFRNSSEVGFWDGKHNNNNPKITCLFCTNIATSVGTCIPTLNWWRLSWNQMALYSSGKYLYKCIGIILYGLLSTSKKPFWLALCQRHCRVQSAKCYWCLWCRGEDREADAGSDAGNETNCCHHHIQVLREAGCWRYDGRQDYLRQIQDWRSVTESLLLQSVKINL